MKTLEQVQEHLKVTYYDCSERICGFLIGVELKEPKQVIKFLREADYVFNFDDFLEWFDEEEDVCGFHIGEFEEDHLPSMSGLFEFLLKKRSPKEEKCCCGKCKCEEKAFKYQGKERIALYREREAKMQISINMEVPDLYLCDDDKNYLAHINKRIEEIDEMLDEVVDEK